MSGEMNYQEWASIKQYAMELAAQINALRDLAGIWRESGDVQKAESIEAIIGRKAPTVAEFQASASVRSKSQ